MVITDDNEGPTEVRECPAKSEIGGLAIDVLNDSISCGIISNPGQQWSTGIVITSDTLYQRMQDSIFSDLRDCEFEPVNFNQHHILAVLTGGSGCSRTYLREVINQEAEDLIECRITIRECGACEPWAQVFHWILVDTLPENQEVLFSVRREKYED